MSEASATALIVEALSPPKGTKPSSIITKNPIPVETNSSTQSPFFWVRNTSSCFCCCRLNVLTIAIASLSASLGYPWERNASTRAQAVGTCSKTESEGGESCHYQIYLQKQDVTVRCFPQNTITKTQETISELGFEWKTPIAKHSSISHWIPQLSTSHSSNAIETKQRSKSWKCLSGLATYHARGATRGSQRGSFQCRHGNSSWCIGHCW